MTKPIPEGYHSVTPTLTVRGAADAIEFYRKAFGAQELHRFPNPDGKSIMHAEIKIGDSIIMLNDEFPQMGCMSPKSVGGTSSAIYLYVEDSDAVFNKAISAGAIVKMPLMDAFWGDRMGSLEDPYGHQWAISPRVKDMSMEEIQKAGAEAMKEFH